MPRILRLREVSDLPSGDYRRYLEGVEFLMKIVDVIWFTQAQEPSTIGIVVVDNGFEKKAYIGTGRGTDSRIDAERIAKNGARLHLAMVEQIIKELERGDKAVRKGKTVPH